RGAAGPAALALPRQAHLGARIDAFRNVDLELPVLPHGSSSTAGGARGRGDLAATEAGRTGAAHGEAALAERNRAGAAALGAPPLFGSGRRAVSPAGSTILRDGHLDGYLSAAHSREERDLDDVLDVVPFRGTGAPGIASGLLAEVEE